MIIGNFVLIAKKSNAIRSISKYTIQRRLLENNKNSTTMQAGIYKVNCCLKNSQCKFLLILALLILEYVLYIFTLHSMHLTS